MVVLPTHGLATKLRERRHCLDDLSREVKHDVVLRTGQPHDDVVLRCRKRVAVRAGQRLVEATDFLWRRIRRNRRPQFGAKASYEIYATDRSARLAQTGGQGHGRRLVGIRQEVELKVCV